MESIGSQVTRIQSAVLDEAAGHVVIIFEQDDGVKVLLRLQPALLVELAGLAGLATDILARTEREAPLSEDVFRLVGTGASPTADKSGVLMRFADKNGFLYSFEAEVERCASLRFQLRRAIEEVRRANEQTKDDGLDLETGPKETD